MANDIRKERVFFLNVHTTYRNRGDLLILRSLIWVLRRFGLLRVSVKNAPAEFVAALGLEKTEITNSYYTEVFRLFRSHEVIMVGMPGHHFGNGSGRIASVLGLIKIVLFRLLLGCRFLQVGTSIGPLDTFSVQLVKMKAKFYSYYGVRDSSSIRLCNVDSIRYFPDLAFVSPDIKEGSQQGDYCLVSFRMYVHEYARSNDYLDRIVSKLLSQFHESETKVLVCHQVDADRAASGLIYKRLLDAGVDVELKQETLQLCESLELIRNARYVLSNRLHVILPALISGVPVRAVTDLSSHSKITSLLNDIGAEFITHDAMSDGSIGAVTSADSSRLLQIAAGQRSLAERILKDLYGDR